MANWEKIFVFEQPIQEGVRYIAGFNVSCSWEIHQEINSDPIVDKPSSEDAIASGNSSDISYDTNSVKNGIYSIWVNIEGVSFGRVELMGDGEVIVTKIFLNYSSFTSLYAMSISSRELVDAEFPFVFFNGYTGSSALFDLGLINNTNIFKNLINAIYFGIIESGIFGNTNSLNYNEDEQEILDETNEQIEAIQEFANWNLNFETETSVAISNVYDLQLMQANLSETYYLLNDIDATETMHWNETENGSGIFEGFLPIGLDAKFNGSLDGKNFSIKNLYINRKDIIRVGIFSFVYGGIIQNLTIEDVEVFGGDNTGGVAGFIAGASVFNSIYVSGAINGEDVSGGIVGRSINSEIEECSFVGNVLGNSDIGGLLGSVYSVELNNSYFVGYVKGSNNVGLIVGDVSGSVPDIVEFNNCYAYSNSGNNIFGSVSGTIGLDILIDNIYYLSEFKQENNSGISLNKFEFMNKDNFEGFNFEGSEPVWKMSDLYPVFIDQESKLYDNMFVVVSVVGHSNEDYLLWADDVSEDISDIEEFYSGDMIYE